MASYGLAFFNLFYLMDLWVAQPDGYWLQVVHDPALKTVIQWDDHPKSIRFPLRGKLFFFVNFRFPG